MSKNIRALAILVAMITLAGCYAQVEDPDVSYIKNDVCGAPPLCVGNNAPLALTSNFIPKIVVNLGDSGLLTSGQSKQGPITFGGSFVVNQAVLTMTTTGNFNGIRSVDLRAAIGSDTCATLSATCVSIATYDMARDGLANQMLIGKGSGVNLLDLANGSHELTLIARATGNAPSDPNWNGKLDLNMGIKARGSFP